MVGCCLLLTQGTDKHLLIPSNNHTAFILWRFGPSSGRGLIIFELSQSHSDTPHSAALLWMSDHSVVGTSTSQHTTLTTDIHATGVIRTRNPSKPAAAELRLRPRGHWNRLKLNTGPVLWHDGRSTHKPIQITFQQPVLHPWRFRKPYYWIFKYYFTVITAETLHVRKRRVSHVSWRKNCLNILMIPSSYKGNKQLRKWARKKNCN